ncbi:MAG: 4Fe-4S dicluster domain-containing protein [Proteobacteria bacterium]|nr:4Fe-4S dicluster domain-containing protein [Pseudomonadota bacterium]
MDDFKYIPGVSTLKLDDALCVGCGDCETVCPHGVLVVRERKAIVVGRDACMECGACMTNCPAGAISLNPGVGCAAYILLGWLGLEDKVKACS